MLFVKVSSDIDPVFHMKNFAFYARQFDGLGIEVDCGDCVIKIQPGMQEAEIKALYDETKFAASKLVKDCAAEQSARRMEKENKPGRPKKAISFNDSVVSSIKEKR